MTPVAASLISALVLTTVLTVMWRNHRERWLGLWAVAAALWMVRYGLALGLGTYTYSAGTRILPVIALLRGVFLLWGAYVIGQQRLPKPWIALFAGDLMLQLSEWYRGDLVLWGAHGVPHYLVFGAATVWSGVIVHRQRQALGSAALIVAAGLALLGLANLSFPWSANFGDLTSILFLVAHASQLIVGFGALMVFYQRASVERDQALERLEAALAKALSGYLPICAHCKAIRTDDGRWEPLERFFWQRHDAAFSHGICPPCEVEHYSEVLQAS